MVDVYDTTNLSSTKGIYEYATAVNSLTQGWFAILMLYSFFLIMNIIFRQYDTKAVALASGFLTAIVALFLLMISWITTTTFFITIAFLAISIIVQIWRSN